MTRVSIIGQGYVGLTISAFAGEHYEVVGFDMNPTVVARLNNGTSHIEGVDSLSIAKLIAKGKYKYPQTINEAKQLLKRIWKSKK